MLDLTVMPVMPARQCERPLGRTASFHEIIMNKGRIWLAASLYINSVAASVIISWLIFTPESPEVPDPVQVTGKIAQENLDSVEDLRESGDRALARGNRPPERRQQHFSESDVDPSTFFEVPSRAAVVAACFPCLHRPNPCS